MKKKRISNGWLLFIFFIVVFIIGGLSNFWEPSPYDQEEESTYEDSYDYYYEENPICRCSYNEYNCKDFLTKQEAQECFEYCGGINKDIHWLDEDNDGLACEWLE